MLKILNKKQVKDILEKIKLQYGIKTLKLDYVFFINNEKKIYIINKDLAKINYSKLRINSFGLYFAALDSNNNVRLTVEGSQIIGKKATKNTLEIDSKDLKLWVKGNDLTINNNLKGFILIKYKNDFYGTGLASKDLIRSYLPKSRRIEPIMPN